MAIAKRLVTAGREGEIGLEETLEFQERLVVEDDVIDLVQPGAPSSRQ